MPPHLLGLNFSSHFLPFSTSTVVCISIPGWLVKSTPGPRDLLRRSSPLVSFTGRALLLFRIQPFGMKLLLVPASHAYLVQTFPRFSCRYVHIFYRPRLFWVTISPSRCSCALPRWELWSLLRRFAGIGRVVLFREGGNVAVGVAVAWKYA